MASIADYADFPLFGCAEAPRTVQIPGYPHAHELRVWLPPSYRYTERAYPTLWVTDNVLELAAGALFGASVGYAPEVILVAIGGPTELSRKEFVRRRTYDFFPDSELLAPAHVQRLRHAADAVGGAPRLRDFLVDELRPRLAEQYRMDPHDHGLAGHSNGGLFAAFALLTRPEGFAKYLISSPANYVDVPRLETEYAAAHDDLDARVFVTAGGTDMTDYVYAQVGIWSTTAALTEALARRAYPSLDLTAAVLPGQTHWSAWPLAYVEGVRVLWREQLKMFSKADWAAMVANYSWWSSSPSS